MSSSPFNCTTLRLWPDEFPEATLWLSKIGDQTIFRIHRKNKWEYHIVTSATIEELQLNDWGNLGWERVSVVPKPGDHVDMIAFLKRAIRL